MSTGVPQHRTPDVQFAENDIITWFRDHPHYQFATRIHLGNAEMSTWFSNMLFNTLEYGAFPYATRCSLIELRRTITEEAYAAVDWAVIRTALLPATEERE